MALDSYFMAPVNKFLICLLALGSTPVWAADPVQIQKGRLAFVRCVACHTSGADEPHKLGPNLHRIIGTRAAQVSDFDYSDALRSSGLTWNKDTLRRWIEDPAVLVPGTSMVYINTLSAAEVEALIVYLEAQAANP